MRNRGQTNRPVARWGMTASFLIDWGDGKIPPDTWDLPIFNALFREKSENGGQGLRSFLKYSRVEIVRPHWAEGVASVEAFPNIRNVEVNGFKRGIEGPVM